MSTIDNAADTERFHRWQLDRLSAYESSPVLFGNGPSDVTVVTYFFRPEETAAKLFPYTKCAILETWRHCGTMKTVIVSHALTRPVEEFAKRFPDWIDVQVEPALKPRPPGDIASMSVDCNSRLHARFSTPWVLIVQDDGFPLRPGLEEFLGKWDYIGAPLNGKDDWITRRLLKTSNLAVNGGFSIRSHAICQEASRLWNAGWKHIPDCYLTQEDYFYARFLPRWVKSYDRRFRFASVDEASLFSVELAALPDSMPFGFHSAAAFCRILDRFSPSRS